MTIKQYRRGLSAFIASEKGQRFFNFAYSIGAAIVIWGALFKILHLQGGNTLLSIGMGTEVLMFILTAFDRPPKEYNWELVFPELEAEAIADREAAKERLAKSSAQTPDPAAVAAIPAVEGSPAVVGIDNYICATPEVAAEMAHLAKTTHELNRVHDTLLESYKAITENAENITGSSTGYVEQMQTLNRNIAALNTIYEIQLKSVSSQLDAIDRVNQGIKDIRDMFENSARESSRYTQEAEKMTRNMQRLNGIYEKMLTAMTINIYRQPDISSEPQARDTYNPDNSID